MGQIGPVLVNLALQVRDQPGKFRPLVPQRANDVGFAHGSSPDYNGGGDRVGVRWSANPGGGCGVCTIMPDISRNAVIGNAHRLGVSGRPSPIKKKTGQPLTLLSMTERM